MTYSSELPSSPEFERETRAWHRAGRVCLREILWTRRMKAPCADRLGRKAKIVRSWDLWRPHLHQPAAQAPCLVNRWEPLSHSGGRLSFSALGRQRNQHLLLKTLCACPGSTGYGGDKDVIMSWSYFGLTQINRSEDEVFLSWTL